MSVKQRIEIAGNPATRAIAKVKAACGHITLAAGEVKRLAQYPGDVGAQYVGALAALGEHGSNAISAVCRIFALLALDRYFEVGPDASLRAQKQMSDTLDAEFDFLASLPAKFHADWSLSSAKVRRTQFLRIAGALFCQTVVGDEPKDGADDTRVTVSQYIESVLTDWSEGDYRNSRVASEAVNNNDAKTVYKFVTTHDPREGSGGAPEKEEGDKSRTMKYTDNTLGEILAEKVNGLEGDQLASFVAKVKPEIAAKFAGARKSARTRKAS